MALHVVIGPPAGGKSTWVLARAQPGDITVDYDRLANALTAPGADSHDHQGAVRAVTFKAREAAIAEALRHARTVDVYVIHSMPTLAALRGYQAKGATLTVIDPGRDTVMERCSRERPAQMRTVVDRWYTDLLPRLAPLLTEHSTTGATPPAVPRTTSRRW